MDLNGAARPAPRQVAEKGPLRIMRLGTPEPAFLQGLDELPAPPVGEALPDSDAGFDVGHPISAEEREALQQAGFSDEDIEQIGAATGAEVEDDALGERTLQDTYGIDPRREPEIVDKGFTHPGHTDRGIPGGTRHLCFVTPCRWYLDVPPVQPDLASLLGGAGVAALQQAQEVEDLLTEHLETHTLIEWATALRKAQDEAKAAKEAHQPGIRSGYMDDGESITLAPGAPAFGARQRSPERQAAVDALDARLGRKPASAAPADPQAIAEHDSRLRAARAERRARQPSPYDLTPKWSMNQESGVVGLKR